MPGNVVQTLRERGFINTMDDGSEGITDPELERVASSQSLSCYAGFDPTSTSLQVGNLLPVMALAHFQRHGHRPIVLVGGATGMIGDPSGKVAERQLLTVEKVEANVRGMRAQLERLLDFGPGPSAAVVVNNADWLVPYRLIEFLRDVGKHFRIGEMLAKDSVRRRLDEGGGISFTEFSYMLLQSYDFLHLFDHYGCRTQLGGSDQWGNITAGVDLIRRVRGEAAYGLVLPLLETTGGEKFGKSAGNAIYLDPSLVSPYEFYQFWVRTDDRDVERFLKLFTLLTLPEIRELAEAHQRTPERREAQKLLAREVTRIIHGEEELRKAQRASEMLFGGEIDGLSDRELCAVFADVPSTDLPRARLDAGISLIDLLAETRLCPSRSEARRLIEAGGVYVNNRRQPDLTATISPRHLASESILVLRTGKRNYHLIRFR